MTTAKKKEEEVFTINHDKLRLPPVSRLKQDRTFPTKSGNRKDNNQSRQGRRKRWINPADDPYPGEAPLDEAKLAKYKHFDDTNANFKSVRTNFHRKRLTAHRDKLNKSAALAARAEILNSEDAGFVEADEGEYTAQLRQSEIVDEVDIASASKRFSLELPTTAPYRIDYTRNGRHLLLGGRRGHIAAFDWLTKKLHCEINAQQTVRDVKWLHVETMLAAAQKEYTYIYDNQGIELHCIKQMHRINRLEFLPYHFLLVGAGGASHLHWCDVSIGQMVRSTYTKEGPLHIMAQNPSNGIIHVGAQRGTVSLWSPNVEEPLVKMLCHPAPLTDLAIDTTGAYMVTTGVDSKMRVWDMRQYRQLGAYFLPEGATCATISGRKCVAVGSNSTVRIFNDVCTMSSEQKQKYVSTRKKLYLKHAMPPAHTVHSLRFAPYEDVLGVGTVQGFTSILVPGSAEPNFDALEANPYQSTKQRREREVRALLDKIQPDMITLDTSALARVDEDTLEERLFERAKILYVRPEVVKFTPRHKAKRKKGAKERAKKAVGAEQRAVHRRKQEAVRKELDKARQSEEETGSSEEEEEEMIEEKSKEKKSVLERFKKK